MKYWFRQKTYGYGFTPVTWEGWLVTFGLVCFLLLAGFVNNFFNIEGPTFREGIRFLLDVCILFGLFIVLFEKKCKGGMQWRWGKNYTESQDDTE